MLMQRMCAGVAGALVLASAVVDAQASNSAICKPASGLVKLAELPEASGVALSGLDQGRLWLHNDSGAEPILVAVQTDGTPLGRVTISGARIEDWEALASAPCGTGTCLFIGDIGDNDARRKQITIYRLEEPPQPSGTAKATAFHAVYPDGAHDAETLLAGPDGTLFVVTKGDTGPIAVYKFPREPQTGSTMTLEPVGKPLAERPGSNARVTDGAVSADGRWVVLRTRGSLTFYPGAEFFRGQFRESHRVDLAALKEPQGEAVVFGPGNTVYLAGEGGGKKQPGTLVTLTCEP